VAKLLNCTPEDVAILVSTGKLRALGKPKPNAVKFFSAVELIALLADREWLDDATKTIGHFWKRKNARRHGLSNEKNNRPKSKIVEQALHPKSRLGCNLSNDGRAVFGKTACGFIRSFLYTRQHV
jgi:hypothetical protein